MGDTGSLLAGAVQGGVAGASADGPIGAGIGVAGSIISGLLNNAESDRIEKKADDRYNQQRNDMLTQQTFTNNMAVGDRADAKLQNQKNFDYTKGQDALTRKTADENTAYNKKQTAKSDGLALLNQQLALNAQQAAPFAGRK